MAVAPAGGPSTSRCAIMSIQAAVAQLAEQRTFNPKVVGSIPTGGMTKVPGPRGTADRTSHVAW